VNSSNNKNCNRHPKIFNRMWFVGKRR